MNPRYTLALASVGLGLGQLGLLRWMERRFPEALADAIAVAAFLAYAGLVTWLIRRVQRAQASGPAPHATSSGGVDSPPAPAHEIERADDQQR